VVAPCTASSARITVLGFGRVSAGEASAEAGETVTLPVSCEAGADEALLPFEVTDLNRRSWPLVIELEMPS